MKDSVSSQSRAHAALSGEDLRGVFLPITTPFDSTGAIDLAALSSNLAKWNQTSINGFVLLGSTGERVNLDEREYLEVITAARENAAEALTFIAGAGQQSTRGTIDEIKRVAATVSVDAFLVITPYFYRPNITQDALVAHYQAVADSSPAPVILYSMPALTGVRIESETAARLSEHENIIGIKDSSNDVAALAETIKLVTKDFAVLTGNGTVLREALAAGACGGILAVGCIASDLCVEIYRAVKAGEDERASKLQSALTPLAQAVTTRFGIGGLKAALDLEGYAGGYVRAPLREPDSEACAEIARCLETAKTQVRRLQPSEIATV
ncbi:MAG TPA: dihydrodipicolinate synthase family protein [Pyrinomonadaceae bacterium]